MCTCLQIYLKIQITIKNLAKIYLIHKSFENENGK